jgi:tight adherence protein B
MLSPDLIPLAIAALAALCAAGVATALLYSLISRRSEGYRRFAAIVASNSSVDRRITQEESSRKKSIEAALRELEEKQRIKKGAKPSLTSRLHQAGLTWSKKTYYIVSVGAGSASFLLSLRTFGIGLFPSIGFGMTAGLLLPHLYVNALCSHRLKKFSAEFPNAVDVIVRGVKSGLPLVDCLRIISVEAQEPVRSEFRAIIEDQTLGIPVDQAVQRLAERIPLAEANFFAIVIALQSQTGGSLSEALSNLSKVLRERKKMKAKIKAVSSEAKASAGIIGSLPVIVTLLIYMTSPHYIMLLFTTLLGNMVLGVCAFWMLVGVLVMRKMINFDI